MIKGSRAAKIDEKSRLRVPAEFRRYLSEATDDNRYYVTSFDGRCAQIYPLPVWEKIEQKLQALPRTNQAKIKFQRITSYYGSIEEIDPQGRILIPAVLRSTAQIYGEVSVLGIDGDHLEVWNKDTIETDMKDNPVTNDDWDELSKLGI